MPLRLETRGALSARRLGPQPAALGSPERAGTTVVEEQTRTLEVALQAQRDHK